jgi:hypothetical protein
VVQSDNATEPQVWPLLEAGLAGQGGWDAGGVDPSLLEGCLCRSQQLRNVAEVANPDGSGSEPLYSWRYPTAAEARRAVEEPRLIRLRYGDGARGAVLLLAGLVGDTTFAARVGPGPHALAGGGASGGQEGDGVVSCLLNNDTIAPLPFRNFGTASRLMEAAEDMFETGRTAWPIERNLLTTGLTAAACESFHAAAGPLETPHLNVCYQLAA